VSSEGPPPVPPPGGPPSRPPPPGPPGAGPPGSVPQGPQWPPWPPPGPGTGGGWPQPSTPVHGAAGGLLPLHPLTVGDVLDGAFRTLRATFATAALVVLLVHGPYQLLSSLVLTQALPELSDPLVLEQLFTEGTVDVGLATRMTALVGGLAIVGLLVQVVAAAALAWVALRRDGGEETTPGAALRVGLSCSGAALGGTVLVGLVGLGLALVGTAIVALLFAVAAPLGVLALVVAVPAGLVAVPALVGAYLLVVPIAVTERAGALTTFRRAMWVVRNRFWRVVGVALLLGLILFAVSIGFSLVFGIVAELAGGVGWVVDAVSATAIAVVTAPVTVFVALLLHLDARIRLEGYDLEVRARELGSL
jgi:hypothetical protein